MKSLLVLSAAVFSPFLVLAQVAAPPVAASPAPAPAPAASATPAASQGNTHDAAATVPLPGQPSGPTLEKNIPLIPETAPSDAHSGKSRAGSSPHVFATFQTEQDIRMRTHLRAAENRALNDPVVQADWVAAHRARKDTERRALLTVYYNHLFDRMIKLDPSIAERAEARRQSLLARMKYTRLGDVDTSENPFLPATQAPSGPNPPASETAQPTSESGQ